MPDPTQATPVDFLPRWYPVLRRQRRRALMQASAVVFLACGCILWVAVKQRRLERQADSLSYWRLQLLTQQKQLRQLQSLLPLRDTLVRQKQVQDQIGQPLDTTGLVLTLQRALPASAALTHLQVQSAAAPTTQPSTPPAPAAGAGSPALAAPPPALPAPPAAVPAPPVVASADPLPPDPVTAPGDNLLVTVQGIAPTDTEVADFLAALGKSPLFSNIAMTYTRDQTDGTHVMRQFEITFQMACPSPLTTASVNLRPGGN